MPLTHIVIEETGQSAMPGRRWMCEMEAGYLGQFRRVNLEAPSLEALLRQVYDKYAELSGIAAPMAKRKPGRPRKELEAANDGPPDEAA